MNSLKEKGRSTRNVAISSPVKASGPGDSSYKANYGSPESTPNQPGQQLGFKVNISHKEPA